MRFLSPFFLLLTFSIWSHAQSTRVDSSLTSLQSHLHHNRAKNIAYLQKTFADSGVNKRLDSLKYSYVMIQAYGHGHHFYTMELYYDDADSIPALVCRNNIVQNKVYCANYESYNLQLKRSEKNPGISKVKYRFVQHYYHGCLVPPRTRARRSVRGRLNNYTVDIYLDKSSGKVTTQTVLPRHFHPFIMKMEGGKF